MIQLKPFLLYRFFTLLGETPLLFNDMPIFYFARF